MLMLMSALPADTYLPPGVLDSPALKNPPPAPPAGAPVVAPEVASMQTPALSRVLPRYVGVHRCQLPFRPEHSCSVTA